MLRLLWYAENDLGRFTRGPNRSDTVLTVIDHDCCSQRRGANGEVDVADLRKLRGSNVRSRAEKTLLNFLQPRDLAD